MAFPREKCISVFQSGTPTLLCPFPFPFLSLALSTSPRSLFPPHAVSLSSSVTSGPTPLAVEKATVGIDPRGPSIIPGFSVRSRGKLGGFYPFSPPTGFLSLRPVPHSFLPVASAREKLFESFRDLLEALRIQPLENQGTEKARGEVWPRDIAG